MQVKNPNIQKLKADMPGNRKDPNQSREGIGTLNEKSLHAEIIAYLFQPGDILESELNGYRIDIHRDSLIIEVQTRNLKKLEKKVIALSQDYQVEIIYPIYKTKYIHRIDEDRKTISRRRSPKSGKLVDVFQELLYVPSLIEDQNITLTIMLIDAEEIWTDDGLGSWRRKHWSISDRKLNQVISQHQYFHSTDLLDLLPNGLSSPFTNQELVELLKITPRLAGKITYTLRKMDLIQVVGRSGRAYLFEII